MREPDVGLFFGLETERMPGADAPRSDEPHPVLDELARVVGPLGAIVVDGDGRVTLVERHRPEVTFDPAAALARRTQRLDELRLTP